MPRKLTLLQGRFKEEFLVDLNGTQAAIRAGYSPRTAAVQAFENLRKPKIQAAIKEAMEARSMRTGITTDRVLLELGRLAFASMGQFAEWDKDGMDLRASSELTEDQLAAVSDVSDLRTRRGRQVKIKLHEKGRALELAMRHLGLLVDRHEVAVLGEIHFTIGKGYDEQPNS